jgi:hypothetical protein
MTTMMMIDTPDGLNGMLCWRAKIKAVSLPLNPFTCQFYVPCMPMLMLMLKQFA